MDAPPHSYEPMLAHLRVPLVAQPHLMAVRNAVFVRKLLEQLAMLGGGAALVLSTSSVWTRLMGIVLLGAAFARNLELMHECMHSSALRGRRANRVFGIALGLPMLTSFDEWRHSHLRHHADVRGAVNREHRLLPALLIASLLMSIVFQTLAILWAWVLPVAVASVVNFHIQLPEHYECDRTSSEALHNSRNMRAGRLAACFVNNNNFHPSHHRMPAVPIS